MLTRGHHRCFNQGEELAAAFMGALMEVIAESMGSAGTDILAGWAHPPPGQEEQSTRRQLLQLAIDLANAKLSTHDSWLSDTRKRLVRIDGKTSTSQSESDGNSAQTGSTSPEEQLSPLYTSPDWHKDLFEKLCVDGFKALNNKLVALERDHFFLALDECAALGPPAKSQDTEASSRISLIAMQRILKAADTLDTKVQFWFLLLDTNSKAYLLAPSGPRASSSRLVGKLATLPPFVYLGFNQMAHGTTIKTARQALSVEHLQRFGRPVSCLSSISNR